MNRSTSDLTLNCGSKRRKASGERSIFFLTLTFSSENCQRKSREKLWKLRHCWLVEIFYCQVITAIPPIWSIKNNFKQDIRVINDPLCQTHNPTSSDHYSRLTLFCFARFWKWERADVQTYWRTTPTTILPAVMDIDWTRQVS